MKEKGIIIIDDIPVICAECMACQTAASGKFLFCGVEKRMVYSAKPDWCPIKPFPEKAYHENYCDGGRYDKGWNDCLKEIEGR